MPAEIRSMIYELVITQEVHGSTVVIYYKGQKLRCYVEQKLGGSISGAAQDQPESSSRKKLVRHTHDVDVVQSIKAAASKMQTCRSVRNEVVPRCYRQVSFTFMPLKHGFETFIGFATTPSDFANSFITTLGVYSAPMMPNLLLSFCTTFSHFTPLQSLTVHRRSVKTQAPPSGYPAPVRQRPLQAMQALFTIQKACPQLSRIFYHSDFRYDLSARKMEGIHNLTFTTATNGPYPSVMEFRVDVKTEPSSLWVRPPRGTRLRKEMHDFVT